MQLRYIQQHLLLYAALLLFAPLKAQNVNDSIITDTLGSAAIAPEQGTLGHKLGYDLKSAFGGVVHTYSGPARWKKDDFIKAGAFIAGTGLLLLADEDASGYFREQGEKVPTWLHRLGWYMGKPQYNYTFTAGIYVTGLITKNEKIRRTGVLIISSATAGGVLQTISKSVAGRARPMAGYGNMFFKPFANEAKYHSFPSGHTILSTTVVYAISKQFSNPWAKAGILSVGLLTPASRLWDSAHWLSDVALGAGISIICVESVDHFLKKQGRYAADRMEDPKKKKISWNFRAGYNQMGIVGVF